MKFKPMLSAKLPDITAIQDIGICHLPVRYPVLGSFKYDGVRAEVQNGKVVSRNLEPIPNRHVQKLFGRPELEGLDGELIVGDPRESDVVFRRTSSAVMTAFGTPPVMFYGFDCFDVRLVFNRRLQIAERCMRKARRALPHYAFDAQRPNVVQSCLQLVQHVQLNNDEELLAFEREALRAGYEGIMLRDPFGMYKQGRSTLREGGLIKVKRFKDGEAVVIGFQELMHNANAQQRDKLGRSKRSTHKTGMMPMGVLGNLLVRDCKTKVTFNIGSGFTAEERKQLWETARNRLMNRVVKYKYFPTGDRKSTRLNSSH